MSEAAETPTRPWFFSPLPPVLLGILTLVALFHDGLTPYRILWRRYTWKKINANPVKVSRPYRRYTMGGGVNQQDPVFVEGKKTRFGVQEAQKVEGKLDSRLTESRMGTRTRVVERQMTPQRIHAKYIEKGLLFPYKEKRWFVSLAFQYPYKGKLYKVFEDKPTFSFESEKKARVFVHERASKWPIKVWVNPDNPQQATAFLEYRGWIWIQLGGFFLFLSLLWFLVSVVVVARPSRSAAEPPAASDPI